MSHNAKRSWAFLASAAVGLAATPALANQPAPTAQIVSEQAPAAASQSLQDASVDWGVKSSFRKYITGPVAGGSQELTGATSNADGSYHFTAAEGTVEADGSYHVKFTGSSVKYTGHHGVLEVTISDLELVIKDGQGSLYANISERPYNGNTTPNPPVQHDHTLIGTFDASSLKNEGGQLTLAASDATKVKLSAEATSVFAGFYQAGQELDALAFSAKLVTKQAPHRRSLPILLLSHLSLRSLHLSLLNPSSLHQNRASLPIQLLSQPSLRQSKVNLLKHRQRSPHRVPKLRHHSPLRLLRHLPQTLQSPAKHPALNRHRSPHKARKPLSPHRLSLRLPMQRREPTCREDRGTLLNPAT